MPRFAHKREDVRTQVNGQNLNCFFVKVLDTVPKQAYSLKQLENPGFTGPSFFGDFLLCGLFHNVIKQIEIMEFATLLSAVKPKEQTGQYKILSALKEFTTHVSGSKDAGYTLTARGFTDATVLLKKMTQTTESN